MKGCDVYSPTPNCLEKAEADIVHHRTHMKSSALPKASTSVSASDAAQVKTCPNEMSYVLEFTFSSGPRGDIAEKFTSDGPGSSISAHGA